MPTSEHFARLVGERRIVVCAGSGGVGKTTVAASLGLAAARAGRKTLVLTIDPAKRLANALGLPELGFEELQVPEDRLKAFGAQPAPLFAMMLDQKRAFDDIVNRYATSAAQREKMLQNRIYKQISSRLAGAHEYAAMFKLHEIFEQNRYDLIVLDTPPTQNALDFLDAPERIVEAIDSPFIEWFLKPYMEQGHVSFKTLTMGAAFVLKRLARFVGSDFLEDVAHFFVEFNLILGGFRKRAGEVFSTLRRPEVAFVLVSSAEPESVRETLDFQRRLSDWKMALGGFVVNRVHAVGPEPPGRPQLVAAIEPRPELAGFGPDEVVQFVADLERTYRELQQLGQRDHEQCRRIISIADGAPLVTIPFFDRDVYDVEGLKEMVTFLAG